MIQHDFKNGDWSLKIQGDLDEDMKLPAIPAEKISKVLIDVGNVGHINSMGIRSWILWIRDIEKRNPATVFQFDRLPLMFIRLMDNIAEMLPKTASVKSFFVSYFCPECMAGRNDLFTTGSEKSLQLGDGGAMPKCEKCSTEMEPEMPEETYLKLTKIS